MRINALEVDGFGIWSGLHLDGLDAGLNVFFGPNEAGKTTLMQFVRSMLYGFSPQRRRYLPPLRGGRPGGSLWLEGKKGRFCLSRHLGDDPAAADEPVLTAEDGVRHGPHVLKALLYDVDESIFNNVFAVGLRELQELSTLGDTEAASLLYNLSAGVDRVSLVEAVRELETARNRLLDIRGGPSHIASLLADRERLRGELGELEALASHYARLEAEGQQADRDAAALDEERNRLQQALRVADLAASLAERWERRASLDGQLAALGPAAEMAEGTIQRLDALHARLDIHQHRLGRLKEQREALGREAEAVAFNRALWRLGPRIEAVLEQEEWIGKLRARLDELDRDTAEAETALGARRERLGLAQAGAGGAAWGLSAGRWASLRPAAKAMLRAERRLAKVQGQAAEAAGNAKALAEQIETGLLERNEDDLRTAVDRAGSLVAQLRRRIQLDQRLQQMRRSQADLEKERRRLLDRQLLPVGMLAGLGGVFILGMSLVLAALMGWLGGSLAWPLGFLGLVAVVGAVAGKRWFERANAARLETCQKQLRMLDAQTKQAKAERQSLDSQLPQDNGALSARLENAEADLAALEELVLLDGRRQAAGQEAEAEAAKAARVDDELAALRRRWQDALAAAGLPRDLAPKQVRSLTADRAGISELQRRLELRREERVERAREWQSLCGRIAQLAAEAGLPSAGEDPIDQLRQLRRELAEQAARRTRLQALRKEERQLRRKQSRRERVLRRLREGQREMFRELGVADEEAFRRLAADYAQAQAIRRERDALDGDIHSAVAGVCGEDDVRACLDDAPRLDERRAEIARQLDALQVQLQERFENRGRRAAQLAALAEDRRPALKRLDLSLVEKRLEEALGQWRVRAAACRVLDAVCKTYERERQPQTLREASAYFQRLTRGRYARVWTRLSHNALVVDDAQGNPLDVESLSRGTREQLFLALRLALAASYARRGAPLPLVLDDVLVNFDSRRAAAAAELLRDFAAAGHQALVFTCHEHMVDLFGALDVEARRLPGSEEADLVPAISRRKKRKLPKRPAAPEPIPYELVAHAEEPVEEPEAPQPAEEHVPAEPPVDEEAVVEPQSADSPADEEEEDDPWLEEDDPRGDVSGPVLDSSERAA